MLNTKFPTFLAVLGFGLRIDSLRTMSCVPNNDNGMNKPVTELIINAVNEPVAPANKAIIPVNSRSTQNECPAASFGAKR